MRRFPARTRAGITRRAARCWQARSTHIVVCFVSGNLPFSAGRRQRGLPSASAGRQIDGAETFMAWPPMMHGVRPCGMAGEGEGKPKLD